MIHRMVKGNRSVPQQPEESSNGTSSFCAKNMDRSIHSIDEEEHQQADNDTSQTKSSFCRDNGHSQDLPRTNSEGDMDDSHHSASSLGHQSNFIQQRIQKMKGAWRDPTMDDSNSSDDIHDDDDDDTIQSDESSTKEGGQLPRTPSLVCMLKMEPINEERVLKNKLNYNDNESSTSIISPQASFRSDVSGISPGDMESPDQPTLNDGETISRQTSFLPQVGTESLVEVEIAPLVEIQKTKPKDGLDDSDTFLFASINSADNITHASDAPDYDYSGHGRPSTNGNKEDYIEPHKRKFIPPTERKLLSEKCAQNDAALNNEVCEVLGLPKDKPRKVHRGIMSRDTEERLRDMIADESDIAPPKQEDVAVGRNESKGIGSSSFDSDDTSVDLAFGETQRKKSEGNDKWERIRRERQLNRESLTFSSAQTSKETQSARTSSGASVAQDEASSELDENSWHNSFNWTKNPLQNKNEGPGDLDSSWHSWIKNSLHRNQQPQNETLVQNTTSTSKSASSAVSASSVGSCSDESSDDDDEDNTWDMNILTEGQYYLSMSMLVYVYGLLRQTSLLGHTEIAFDEVDVNSSQSESRMVKSHRYLDHTKSAGFIIRVVMDELEKKGAFSDVEAEGDICVLREFKQWVHDSRANQLDSATVDTIRELRRKVARKRWKRAILAVRLAVRLGKDNKNDNKVDMRLVAQESFRRRRRGSLGNLKQHINATGSRALASSMIWLHDQRSKIMDGLGVTDVQENTLVDQKDIRDIVNDAFEQPRFFKEGSLLSNLIESSIEVVWFSDRHPNDVVYSICCNRRQKRVSVVFRGTVNSHNWLMNLKFFMTTHPNPIAENYPGREETLGFHTGYLLYMTRQRKDDSLTKIEEIFSKIDSIGRELAPDGDYNLSITGHSLGGALATLLTFFAATNQMFEKVKTIRAFTYAAPRVGCYGFARAFQHLESKGKIRLARFSNVSDLIPLIPFHGMDRLWRSYNHVGMHIRLLRYCKASQYWLRQALDVTYPKDNDWWAQLHRSFWASLFVNLNTPAGYKYTHTLSEHQKRIRFTLEFRTALAQTDLLHDKKRSRIKTLDEYYFIRGGTLLAGTKELTKIAIEESTKQADRRRTKNFMLLLLIIAIAEALLLLRFLDVSLQCESLPLIFYPLYPLIGCQYQKENNRIVSSTPSLEERDVFLPRADVTTSPLHEKRNQTAKTKSKFPQFRWPRALSFRRRKVVSTTFSELPCYWGHCIITPQSRLPWGVRLAHLPMPSDFEYQVGQELALVSEQLVSDAHSFVSGSVEIQSNISDAALQKLKAAETKLQAVEYYDTTIDIDNILSKCLKHVVRLVIDFLESLLL